MNKIQKIAREIMVARRNPRHIRYDTDKIIISHKLTLVEQEQLSKLIYPGELK